MSPYRGHGSGAVLLLMGIPEKDFVGEVEMEFSFPPLVRFSWLAVGHPTEVSSRPPNDATD